VNTLAVAERGARGGANVAFPEKLYEMLQVVDAEDDGHIISWQPHGRCFLIHRKKEFVDHVMPRFFHQSKLTSFQRQLNLYGFVRLTAGKDRGAYYHELFLRGRPDLCRHMTRTRVKGNGMKAASSPSTEPDFYSMEYCLWATGHRVTARRISDDFSAELASQSASEASLLTGPTPLPNPLSHRAIKRKMSRIISPPNSPQQFHKSVDLIELPFSSPMNNQDWEADPFWGGGVSDDCPHTGDVVHFEGLQFRYMDHLDLEDEICAELSPACVWV
jgi:hypothetical protein